MTIPSPTSSPNRWHTTLLLCPVLGIISLPLVLIITYGVSIPFWDEAMLAPLFLKLTNGSLELADLTGFHQEHRLILPKLIILTLGKLNGWDVRYEMALTYGTAIGISACLGRLQWLASGGKTGAAQVLLFIIINMMVFSPAQHFNWLSGFQTQMFIPVLCLCLGLVVNESNRSFVFKVAAMLGLSLVATASFASGLLLWLVVPLAFWSRHACYSQQTRKVLTAGIVWSICFAVTVMLYFKGYARSEHLPGPTYCLSHPVEAVVYMLAWLGNPLAAYSFWGAIAAGLAISLVTILVCFKLRHRFVAWSTMQGLTPWMALGAFSLLSGLMTTAGRLGLGIETSLHSRYATPAIYFLIALIYLYYEAQNEAGAARQPLGTSAIALILLAAHIVASFHALDVAHHYYRKRLMAKSMVLFWADVTSTPRDYVFPEQIGDTTHDQVRKSYIQLRQAGFFSPHRTPDPKLTESAHAEGSFETFTPSDETKQTYESSGWAMLPGDKEPSHCILLAYRLDAAPFRWFAVLPNRAAAPDYAFSFNRNSRKSSEWREKVSLAALPPGNLEIRAWAYDSKHNMAYPLLGTHFAVNGETVSSKPQGDNVSIAESIVLNR